MFRSLHRKLVLVLVLLIVSVMAVVGTFLINSVTSYHIREFQSQMASVFTSEFILTLEQNAGDGGALQDMIEAYSAPLGIDEYRCFYVLDGRSGAYLSGSDDDYGAQLQLTPNILTAMNGQVGQYTEKLGEYFDVAVPIRDGEGKVIFVVGVLDDKTELQELNWNLFTILIRAILFGLVVAIFLSFLLSKTITNPVERLTDQAARIAAGDFSSSAQIESEDEIGILSDTFDEMSVQLETTLRQVEEERNKLDTLFQHMADGMVAFDSEGMLLQYNTAAEEMLNRHLEETLRYTDIFPEVQVRPEDLAQDGRSIEIDFAAGPRFLKIYFAPIRLGNEGKGLMAVLHDVTEQRKLDDSRREFVANVSHELRTPLTNVRGYAETLMSADDIDRGTQMRFLGVISSEADRMTRIVKDLLTLTRLDYNRMEMNMQLMDLRELGQKAAQAMEGQATGQGLTLTCELPEEMPVVMGDPERIQQVIINIITNAIKYNKPQGSIAITGGTEGEQVYLRVEDTGIGVPKADVERLFERFYRVDKARSRESGGTGLGLAIAKQIVETHGGHIGFDSEYGKGSVVTLYLPQHREEGEANG
ncbi:MAG: HAMP domain-containing protein [Clostridia bacterium]|nr:HAMP domain-containing protein [Clostridia bacterium]